MKIDEIKFGKIDAYNELQEFGEEYYISSFHLYEKYKIENFFKGENYYICGNKGTGKTAFLKYLECKLSEDAYNLVIPIRFKSLDSVDKSDMPVAYKSPDGLMVDLVIYNQGNIETGIGHISIADNNKLVLGMYRGERIFIKPGYTKV